MGRLGSCFSSVSTKLIKLVLNSKETSKRKSIGSALRITTTEKEAFVKKKLREA